MSDYDPAEEYLKIVESVGSLVGALDMIRQGLEERGWDGHHAQTAAIMAYDNAMKHSLIEAQAYHFGGNSG